MTQKMDRSDAFFGLAQRALAVLLAAPTPSRPVPRPPALRPEAQTLRPDAENAGGGAMTAEDRQLSGALMRVNHVGEVCAQALYEGQALAARSPEVADCYRKAASEEADHLAWTSQRLAELGARPSVLNPLWYAGSFVIGAVAARMSDRVGLGFMAETERQVEEHLGSHLERLPAQDHASRVIVRAMQADEIAHGEAARARGALPMPLPVRLLMKGAARVMTRTAHYL